MMATRREDYGLPPRVFLYTTDQVALIIGVSTGEVERRFVHWSGRSVGARPMDKFLAHDIAPRGDSPMWRVSETELIRWMRYKGFRVYTRQMSAR